VGLGSATGVRGLGLENRAGGESGARAGLVVWFGDAVRRVVGWGWETDGSVHGDVVGVVGALAVPDVQDTVPGMGGGNV